MNWLGRSGVLAVALSTLVLNPVGAQLPAYFTEDQFKSAGHEPVDGRHLQEMLVGNTGYLTFLRATEENPAGSVNVHYWRSSSRVMIVSSNRDSAKRFVANFPWWIDGDRYCNRAYVLELGSTNRGNNDIVRCRTLYDLGGIYVCQDGTCGQLLRIVPGNAEKL